MTMLDLQAALLANRDEIEKALQAALQEQASLQARCADLEDWIGRARVVLGLDQPERDALTLHEAMAVVLRQERAGLSAPALADELNRRRLYRKKNGQPVGAGQIHARAGAYHAMFARADGRIVLRSEVLTR